ncbi:hypothetical protein LEP1GSC058_2243 [Leptospira fainei serovar Hurstbridge str. BUT 6]|uniref:Uncharacterized protein n=1 Tax=Leptospira fainei serovar Hurstbridge str. BUT 6 TaxID=1193011 RepID=S3V4B8_9LEPT|nr:hypothetical protein LEP1GSC058_2243 [Leptospira fainei serovar Hurstbridge str. BUT 6]
MHVKKKTVLRIKEILKKTLKVVIAILKKPILKDKTVSSIPFQTSELRKN